jgi:class 3 adenylate cyclase
MPNSVIIRDDERNPMAIRTLQRRMVLLVLLPVGMLLAALGFLGYFKTRDIMLDQWREAAILRLQRAAHHVDMRLDRPVQLVELLGRTGDAREGLAIQSWIVDQLKEMQGVTDVLLDWEGPEPWDDEPHMGRMGNMFAGRGAGMGRMMRFHRARIARITSPAYDPEADGETVNIVTRFLDETGSVLGNLTVTLRFDALIRDIQRLGWWQSDMACLVDEGGRILARTAAMESESPGLGECRDPLARAVLEGLRENTQGTLLGPGHPPETVAGYYHTANAPWALVLFASGEQVLSPIIRFRNWYMAAGGAGIVLVLLLIRFAVGRITKSVRRLSRAAERIAEGGYGEPLPMAGHDEIGQLTRSFNTMVEGLRERDFIRNTFGRYVDREVAHELMRRPEASMLGGERREVAVLMSDIRGFTSLSESLPPEATLNALNLYFGHMIEVIKRNHGIIVDFIGDGVLAFFDPLDGPLEPSLRNAVQCACDMQAEMDGINRELAGRGLPQLEAGIGVNAGTVVVGNIGSETRAKYGIVGPAVNLTQRIQDQAGPGDVVISDAVTAGVPKGSAAGKSFQYHPKGVRRPLTLHFLECPAASGNPER